jgi:acetyl-CoA C-acetyltransferase
LSVRLAESHGISREAQDEFALGSQRRARAAVDAGRFDDEIVAEIKTRKETVEFKVDEHIRPDASLEGFAELKPAFNKNGTVTAGNASGVNDAGAAVIVMSADRAEKSDADPVLRGVRRGAQDDGHRARPRYAHGARAGRQDTR